MQIGDESLMQFLFVGDFCKTAGIYFLDFFGIGFLGVFYKKRRILNEKC
jgi:hypothetical protein